MTDAALYAMPRFEACLRNSEVRYSDKWSEITQIMNQRWLLITAVAVMLTLPSLAQETGLSVSFLFAFTSCSLIWAQELAVIQWRYREENVEFTNRFNSKFSSYPGFLLRYTHIILACLSVLYLVFTIGYIPDLTGIAILLLVFSTLTRILDPILGIMSSIESIPWTSLVGYIVVLMFSISSGLDPEKLEIYQVPVYMIQPIPLAMVAYITLNLRLVYYQKFCFLHEQNLESQLRLILIPLFFLSVHQMINILDALDLSSVFNR